MVAPGQVVFTLMELSRVIVEIGVPEKSIGQIKRAQDASVSFEAIPGQVFSGKVTQVGVSSLPNSRLFKVEVTVPNPELVIKPGMTASCVINTDRLKDVFVFSLDATVMRNGRRVLYLVDNGTAKELTLENYMISGDKIIVQDDLPLNKQVITSGQGILFDGIEISILRERENP